MARILIAASPQPRAIAERMLAGHDLTSAATVGQVTRYLGAQTFDMILCTIVFDDSRMFDLLRLVKSKPEWARTPFVCARIRTHVLDDPVAWEAIDLACQALGAAAFLNVADYPRDPEREMRRAIERLLRANAKNG